MKKKIKRAIVEPLGLLKHKIADDRTALLKVSLRLRDWDRCPDKDALVRHVIEDIEDFNNRRLKETWEMVNKIIEEA